jgi:hypothetical protein
MEPQIIVLGRKSPWPVLLGSAFAIAVTVAFSIWSFQTGFDVSRAPGLLADYGPGMPSPTQDRRW